MKILVVRPDRIGDVVLSTPVLELLNKAIPGCTVDMLVQESVKPILKNHPFIHDVLTLESLPHLKEKKYDAAIVLQVNSDVAWAVRAAKIPVRVGPFSKWYSYLCFNAGLRQHRSASLKNEAEYNLDLAAHAVKRLGFAVPGDLSRFRAKLVASKKTDRAPGFILVHPGMGGSALNWPIYYYGKFIKILTERGCKVAMGGAPSDREMKDAVLAAAKEAGAVMDRVEMLAEMSLEDYMAVMMAAAVVVAPSTGPLHLAAGLGKSVVSFYPPIPVQSAKRWGPFGAGKTKVFSPEVTCPQKYKCAGAACKYFDCMDTIAPKAVAEEVIELAKNASA